MASAPGPVGVDLEPATARVPPDMALHPSEDGDPLWLWVAKEALLKSTGEGIARRPPESFRLDEAVRAGGFALTRLDVPGHVAALCTLRRGLVHPQTH